MNIDSNELILHSKMNQARCNHAICYLNKNIYVAGGHDGINENKPLKSFEKLDIE